MNYFYFESKADSRFFFFTQDLINLQSDKQQL